MRIRWWIPVMILACLLWAMSCAQRGAAEVTHIGQAPAASGPVTVEEDPAGSDPEPASQAAEQSGSDEERTERPSHGGIPFVVLGEGKDLTEFSRPPKMTAAGTAEAVRPNCTWTADGATMIACGMVTLDLVTAGLLETVPFDIPEVPAPELLFEVEPDRVTVKTALLKWDENGELLTGYDDFVECPRDETYGDYIVTRMECVAEITAEWDERDGYGGHAIYVFRVGETKE